MKKILLTSLFLTFGAVAVAQPGGFRPIEVYSIFVESYKNNDYQTALRYGRWLINERPDSLEGLPQYNGERNFTRMVEIYKGVAMKKEDPTVRSAYMDSAVYVFNKVFETYGKDDVDHFQWYYKKGRFLQENASYIDNGQRRAYEQYQKMFDLDAKRATEMGDGYYVRITIQNLVSNDKKDKALQMVKEAEPHAGEKLLTYFDEVRDQLFDSPEERIAYLNTKIEDNPEDVESLEQLFDLYKEQENLQEAQKIADKLYQINPNFEYTRRLAEIVLDNANYDRAIKLLKEASKKSEDKMELRQVALDLSDAYTSTGNLETARRYARQASEYDPDWGRPFIQIANIYSQAVNDCTSGRSMTREDRVVYWLVLDYLDKARQVDKSVTSTVKRQYQSYDSVVPTQEQKFFMSWEEGDRLKVDKSLKKCYGWINETTTVR